MNQGVCGGVGRSEQAVVGGVGQCLGDALGGKHEHLFLLGAQGLVGDAHHAVRLKEEVVYLCHIALFRVLLLPGLESDAFADFGEHLRGDAEKRGNGIERQVLHDAGTTL